MPRTGITAYDLLISSPGDVDKYVDTVKECVEDFNRLLGRINSSEIVCKHWSTDSYAQSGDKPQELLNKQFVRDCDAAVAIFWTRFGTPTDKYGSGSEEEIEEMLSAGKQVFVYFIDEPLEPSSMNNEQYKKVQAFRESYKDKGIYRVVKNIDDFKKQFTNDLTLHFFPLISGGKGSFVGAEITSALVIADYDSGTNTISTTTNSFCKSKAMVDRKKEILRLITELSAELLPERTTVETSSEGETSNDAISNYLKSKTEEVVVNDIVKFSIEEFAKQEKIDLPLGFWNTGNLTRTEALINPMFGGEPSLNGSEEEKKRYTRLEELYLKIEKHKEYFEYLHAIDKYIFVNLILSNTGTDYDEDIDVKLHITKGKIVKANDIPTPGILTIDSFLDTCFLEKLLKMEETDSVSEYSNYPIMPTRIDPSMYSGPFNQPSAQQEYEFNVDRYNDIIEQLYCYEVFEGENEDVVVIHFPYIKQHTSMAFPSSLIFTDVPDKIEYEIISKRTANVIEGVLQKALT